MAAYMRSMTSLLSIGRNTFPASGGNFIVQSNRYLRGLRRKPVKVLYPEDEVAPKVTKPQPQPQPQPMGQNVRREREPKAPVMTRHHTDCDFVRARTNAQSAIKDTRVATSKDVIDGLRIERAFPGDKRLS